MKRSRKNSRRRLKNCVCALLTAGACWNYLASCGVTERAEVTRIVLPKEEMAREAGAAAAGQEGLENAALPVPGILSWMIWGCPSYISVRQLSHRLRERQRRLRPAVQRRGYYGG